MTQDKQQIRRAMTAIAAALALSATPLAAQETAPQPTDQPDPAADPPAPEATAEPAAPPAPTPKVETAKTETISTATRVTRTTSKSVARAPVRRASASAPAAPAPTAAPAAIPEAVTPAPPAQPMPAAAPEPAPVPAAQPAPASGSLDSLMADLTSDEMLPIAAGGAALGLFALGGAGIAMRRRKRRRELQEFEARQQFLDAAEAEPALELNTPAEVPPKPAIARAPLPTHDPVPQRTAPVGKLPSDVDPSDFGPHVRAAYRGPTHDNPSVSLEYRLRQAAAMDEQEAQAAELKEPNSASQPAAKIPAKGNWESRSDSDFLFYRSGSKAPRKPLAHTKPA